MSANTIPGIENIIAINWLGILSLNLPTATPTSTNKEVISEITISPEKMVKKESKYATSRFQNFFGLVPSLNESYTPISLYLIEFLDILISAEATTGKKNGKIIDKILIK